ncbi:DUF1178 family protein [Acidimangrovimonas pyrenivorans]|uniref:DUF1178 family protein n=1 Tax=Acidimangrovimonas pyrenivorans TaxID=2030798 RepID=A0ABV7AJN8_9RHOB
MIRYALKCTNDHEFESWFASADAFDKLAGARMVACPACGSTEVSKSLMAPSVRSGRKATAPEPVPEAKPAPAQGALTKPANPMEQALAALRKQVESQSEYVGRNFVKEARAIHDGGAPERAIHGEAKLEEARALIEDGIPVARLPFLPNRKTN